MVRDEQLERFLTGCGLTWRVIPRQEHVRLGNEWEGRYGDGFGQHFRRKTGARAEAEYRQQSAGTFMIVPFLGSLGGPHSINKPEPRKAAYECDGDGTVPDLSPFAANDFFIAPPDLSWTMVHTHEDHALGGPYFVRERWLVPPTRKRAW